VKRRTFITLMGGAAMARSQQTRAQQNSRLGPRRVPVIGGLLPESGTETFRQGLRDLGYDDGKNIQLEFRPVTPAAALPHVAAELVQLNVDIIVVTGSEATRAAQQATRTIPIVMAAASDPVGTGFAATLARPGGNITGLSLFSSELSGKRLELLREVIGHLSRAIVLWNPDDPPAAISLKETEVAARQLGIELHPVEVRRDEEFDAALASAVDKHAEAVDILPSLMMRLNSPRIAAWALQEKLPAIFWARDFAASGGLMSYGPDLDGN
jgi:putative ABC transport system substrate-binding protein